MYVCCEARLSVNMFHCSDHLIQNCKIKNPSERLHVTQHTALLGYVSDFLSKVWSYIECINGSADSLC